MDEFKGTGEQTMSKHKKEEMYKQAEHFGLENRRSGTHKG